MNDDHVKGHAKDIKGTVKETFGDMTGDRKTEREGQADQAEGKIQKTVGDVKDKLSGR